MTPLSNPSSKPSILFTEAPHPREETGIASAPYKYLTASLLIAAVAASVFHLCFPAAVALMVSSTWLLWSGIIVAANRAAHGKPFASWIHRFHSIAMEFNSGVVAAGLFPFTHFQRYHRPRGALVGRPILLVNGYLSFGSTWQYLRAKLVRDGFGPIYTVNIGSGKSIEMYAMDVQRKIKEIQKQTGRKDIILIGHSKGGLVSALYASQLAKETGSEVTDIIGIGSPFSGTRTAYIGVGKDAYEMRLESDFHKKLRYEINRLEGTRFFHVASETDEIVPHTSSLIGKTASQHLLLKDTGHLNLVFSSRVADQIARWLKQ